MLYEIWVPNGPEQNVGKYNYNFEINSSGMYVYLPRLENSSWRRDPRKI